ncbi:MAG: hypothetical protein FDZ75_07055 [Actinobacteria bacterium]|nr:MAG: hypothetical protein FDZ75_07055 [Actinomycetota bacterium]
MTEIKTRYGNLQGASYTEFYPDGTIKECVLNEKNELETPYGKLIPQYQDDGIRRKQTKSLSFHKNGSLKGISLQNRVEIKTSVGMLSAEYITFYENGSIRRIFPLDGRLSGYWAEEDEYKLATELELKFSFGNFKCKIIGIQFYDHGAVKSITFWPKDKVTVTSPVGAAPVRIGISLYPDGKIKSFEPARPLCVDTPIGKLTAYDRCALGIHGDSNSLSFSEQGKIEHLVTSAHKITVTDQDGAVKIYQPDSKPNMFNPEIKEPVPVSIRFGRNTVMFNNSEENEFIVDECIFSIEPFILTTINPCSSCTDCSACG